MKRQAAKLRAFEDINYTTLDQILFNDQYKCDFRLTDASEINRLRSTLVWLKFNSKETGPSFPINPNINSVLRKLDQALLDAKVPSAIMLDRDISKHPEVFESLFRLLSQTPKPYLEKHGFQTVLQELAVPFTISTKSSEEIRIRLEENESK